MTAPAKPPPGWQAPQRPVPFKYDPRDWYWIVGGQVYSSARKAYVPPDDPTYLAWLAVEGHAPAVVATEQGIWNQLARGNVMLPPGTTESDESKDARTEVDLRNAPRSHVDRGDVQIIAPTAGFTYQVPDRTGAVIFNPATNLSTGTFKLPLAPLNRQRIEFIATKNVANLTFATDVGGHAIINAPGSVGAGKCITAVFGGVLSTWIFFA